MGESKVFCYQCVKDLLQSGCRVTELFQVFICAGGIFIINFH